MLLKRLHALISASNSPVMSEVGPLRQFLIGTDCSFRGAAEVGGRQSSLPRSIMTIADIDQPILL